MNHVMFSIQFAVLSVLAVAASAAPQSRNPANIAEFEAAQAEGRAFNVSETFNVFPSLH